MNINEKARLAFQFFQTGNLEQAEYVFQEILKVQPSNCKVMTFLGLISFQLKKYDSSIDFYRKALQFAPSNPELYYNLGIVFQGKGQLDEAVIAYQKALQINPNLADTCYNLGTVLQDKGRLDEAMMSYHKAIEINPTLAEAHDNIGICLRNKGQLDEAIMSYKKALQINPNLAEAYDNLGETSRQKGRLDEAIEYLHEALRINPSLIDAHYHLGLALFEYGKFEEARKAFDMAIHLNHNCIKALWAKCISQLPIIYPTEDEIPFARNLYHNELLKLQQTITLKTQQDIDEAAEVIGTIQPFYLAHQGMNVRELHQLYGNLVHRIMESKYPEFTKERRMPSFSHGDPIRVGIISGYFYNHSVWKLPIKEWVGNIDKSLFKLYGYYTGFKKDEATAAARLWFNRFVEDIYHFKTLCEIIQKDNLHILIFAEIGQDPITLKLASLRLAPVQCVSALGATVTSGLETIDYALSSDLMEPMDADNHYTEQLIRLPNLGIYKTPEDISWTNMSRAIFGLRQKSIIYLCCHQLPTHLPQYDEIYPRIAQQIGDCQFVFIPSLYSSFVIDQFRLRLMKAFARFNLNYEDYIIFLPFLNKQEYLAINYISDVFLDTIDWSACNSAFEAIACNLPIVTLPGAFMRGRHAMGILTMMGITDTLVSTIDEYIETSVKLGKDPEWRFQISEKIAKNKHCIYYDRRCIKSLEGFFRNVVEERLKIFS